MLVMLGSLRKSCVSRRRRIFRLSTGVNRKSCYTRWMGSATVGVVSVRGNKYGAQLKASEGVEKSCRNRRSRRGQRRGKSRSRGRQPRSPPPLRPKPAPGSRLINHSGRKLIWSVIARNKLDTYMRKKPSRPVKGDLRYQDGYKRFRALSWKVTQMGVPWGAFEHPGGNFEKYLDTLWVTEQAHSDFFSLLRHVREEVIRPKSPDRTEPVADIREVIIDGDVDYLCRHCQTRPAYRGRADKAVPYRRVCNMNDLDCFLRKKQDRENDRSSLHRSNAKRVPRGRARR
jgi:hypothetical protein